MALELKVEIALQETDGMGQVLCHTLSQHAVISETANAIDVLDICAARIETVTSQAVAEMKEQIDTVKRQDNG